MDNVVQIHEHDKFKGARIPFYPKAGIIEDIDLNISNSPHMYEQLASSKDDSNDREGLILDTSIKGYIDDQMNTLEKSIERRLESQEKLLSEKIDHLHTKTDKSIHEGLTKLKEDLGKERKEDKKFFVTTAVAISAIVVAILGYAF